MSTTRTVLAVAIAIMVTSTIASGQTTWYVDDDNCPGPGTGTEVDPFCAIQSGIDAAALANGDDVLVADGTYNELINFNGKAITVHSTNGAAVTTIDGGGAGSVVSCISGENPDTVLDGFTITGGTGSACFVSSSCGGGMLNDNSSNPTVTNCTFSSNSAHNGGGMYNEGSSPTVSNCTFSGNSAGAGGGMLNEFSFATVTNCTFSGNSATHGGGMADGHSFPTVTNCTFSGNFADLGAGMVSVFSGLTVTNCTFSGNFADLGGGMYNALGGAMVANCILWGDSPDEIFNEDGSATVSYSDVQGGLGGGTVDGGGNIDADPLFVDPDGADDILGTEDDNLRLLAGSPCIDAADNTAPGLIGITTDLDGNSRFVDDEDTTDTGNGTPPIVDMGAYEFSSGALIPTVSEWGLAVMGLLMFTIATLLIRGRRVAAA